MKAKIEQINRYEVSIGDKTWDNFRKCEEWEGMIKFSGPSGTLVLDGDNDSFTDVFRVLFSSNRNKEPVELDIIKASDGLIPSGET